MKLYNIALEKRLLLAILSGASVILIALLDDYNPEIYWDVHLTDLLIGTVFALLVMVPFQPRKNYLKSLILIIASIVIYVSMTKLVVHKYGPLNLNYEYGIIVSGVLGAILTGTALMFVAPFGVHSKYFILLIVCGAIGGFVFSKCIDSQSIYISSVGYIVWQTLVCFAIHQGKR